MRNIKLALRTLFKTPFVTVVAILSLALGIGANAAIFSMFDEIILRKLPVHEPERLVNLGAPGPKPGSTSCNQAGDCEQVFSYPMYRDLEKAETGFAGLAAHRIFGTNIAYEKQSLEGEGVYVSGSYFPLLGVRPTLGRLLTPADDQTIGGHPVVVLSHAFWETRLGADPRVVDRTITVNGQPLTIVGVGPKDFHGTTMGARPFVYVPMSMRGVLQPTYRGFDSRTAYGWYVFGRLKPGTTMEQAAASANTFYSRIINEVEVPLQEELSEQTMARFKARKLAVADGQRGQSSMHREASTPLFLLFGITGIVLLIACANIANLLLSRAATRGLEMAVRLSLGASRRQLLGQLLTESVLLAIMGGIVSLVVARATLAAMAAMLPADASGTLTFTVNETTALFALALSVATGIGFGLFPALHSTNPDIVSSLRAGAGKHSGHKTASRFRAALATSQIALSMALLISAGLFIRSLHNVSKVELGIRADSVVTFAISPVRNGYDSVRTQALFERVENELAALPGVVSVGASMVPVLSGSNWGQNVSVEGFEQGPDTDAGASYNEVGPGFYRTLGMDMLSGRTFTAADGPGTPRVAIVNQSFVKKFGLGRDAVGKRMATGRTNDLNIQIVGVVRDAKYNEVKDTTPPVFFLPYRQLARNQTMNFYVRSSLGTTPIIRAIPGVVARLDPNLPIQDLKTLPQQIRENTFLDRMISTLSAGFAVLATMLAAVGLYGVLAYSVAQRTREIGVRMALGANAGNVRAMVLRQVGVMTAIGAVIGMAAAFGLGRAAKALLFEVEGHDPLAFSGAVVVLVGVSLLAGYLPARRASQVEPMQALRYE